MTGLLATRLDTAREEGRLADSLVMEPEQEEEENKEKEPERT